MKEKLTQQELDKIVKLLSLKKGQSNVPSSWNGDRVLGWRVPEEIGMGTALFILDAVEKALRLSLEDKAGTQTGSALTRP